MNFNDIISDYRGQFLTDAISHGNPDIILSLVRTATRFTVDRTSTAELIGHLVIENCIKYAEGMDDPTAETESEIRELAFDDKDRERFISSGGAP